ncbi:ABC transporter permease [Enterovibrio sp. ZSDZ42]|uniref:ABC transporter permease n=1 Tax=Enterovibrio gelatinilyticus TaxID=2899819 RepID=A0ABT5R609_9GAMM|nr:ABC transporter permease [Enterovibrio sp. ZSDZ42]MDD1795706.1 ABC transporter permease [Enterovibrio sp. ZSDZ42]
MNSPTLFTVDKQINSYWQATPLAIVLLSFLVIPMIVIVTVSFWDYNEFSIIPDFIFENYEFLLTSKVTWLAYLQTFKYAFLTWAITLLIGFFVSYYLAFHIKSNGMQTVLFLICTVPFLTSNIIRMISWIPLLGRNGLINTGLTSADIISSPIEWLLYSDFAIVLAYVHLYTMFMVVPIFNSMMRIDRSQIEAAIDAGATPFRILVDIIIPLCKSGITIGSIFIFTLVMGDFITVKVMGGGIKANVAVLIYNEISLLQYPAAAASAVILLISVIMMLIMLFRLVDIRKEV